MSKDERYASGAIGFVLGIAVLVGFIVVSEYSDRASVPPRNTLQHQSSPQAEGHSWIDWSHRAVYWEDSLAQWTMAVLAVAATAVSYLAVRYVQKTLTATLDGVAATREVGRDQSRAYVHAERAEISWGDAHASNPSVTLSITNSGATPAKWFEVSSRVVASFWEGNTAPRGPVFEDVDFPEQPYRWNAIGAGATLTAPALRNLDRESLSEAMGNLARIDVLGLVRYETFFGEVFESEFWFVVRQPTSYQQQDDGREYQHPMQRAVAPLRTFERIPEAH